MTLFFSSIWVLYKNFFDAVPGQKGLLTIGLLLIALGYFQSEVNQANLLITAGIAFVVGFTLLFAGPQFRKLASVRRHRLIPHFRVVLIISYLITLVSLSLIVLIGCSFLDKQKLTLLNETSTTIIWLTIWSFILITSLFGFLPGYLRYPFWLLLIVGVINIQHLTHLPIEIVLISIIGIAMISLGCFIYFVGIIKRPIFYTKQAISLSKYLPGLYGSFQDKGVTAVGSILLGMSDGNSSRFIRAFFSTCLIPMLLACAVVITDKYQLKQFFANPLFLLISLKMAVLIHIHFVLVVTARKRFIWLRVGGDRQHINRIARKVLARERWWMVWCYGLWCVPVLYVYPENAPWLLGVSALLWSMILFFEQLLINLKAQLTQRAEFYLLLSVIGVVISIIAIAHVQGLPQMLWVGASVFFLIYILSVTIHFRGNSKLQLE